ncbi:MAG TPA: hypothetical protein VFB77_02775, partial [Acidimicrobiales bacterium]|nr:hypothetical protein [Acidimicrobiales bacterium]
DQDAARTFFVAMVASATITTRSSSFFMAASVAGAAPRGVRRRRATRLSAGPAPTARGPLLDAAPLKFTPWPRNKV